MRKVFFFLPILAVLWSANKSTGFAQQDSDWTTHGRPLKSMKLKVSPNRRYLVNQDGKPFFYLGDTAWTLLKRLNREEVEEYFKNRVAKGFTVIQAYVLRGLEVPNLYGDLTLIDRDPTRPNEAFFKNVDYVVNKANELGLVMGLVVTSGEHVRQVRTKEQVFNTANAFAYGRFLGNRYKDNCVIWLLGGDRPARDDLDVWRAMARGFKEESQGTQLMSYHGPGPAAGITAILHLSGFKMTTGLTST